MSNKNINDLFILEEEDKNLLFSKILENIRVDKLEIKEYILDYFICS